MWHRSRDYETFPVLTGQDFAFYQADGRCDGARSGRDSHHHPAGELPDEHMSQIICESCTWHLIGTDTNDAVEAWHDHVLPGWRELPAVPFTLVKNRDSPRGGQRMLDWAEEHYPEAWQQPGHPITTERSPGLTRYVPGRSPWGGCDFASLSS